MGCRRDRPNLLCLLTWSLDTGRNGCLSLTGWCPLPGVTTISWHTHGTKGLQREAASVASHRDLSTWGCWLGFPDTMTGTQNHFVPLHSPGLSWILHSQVHSSKPHQRSCFEVSWLALEWKLGHSGKGSVRTLYYFLQWHINLHWSQKESVTEKKHATQNVLWLEERKNPHSSHKSPTLKINFQIWPTSQSSSTYI